MSEFRLPRMGLVRQRFPESRALDIPRAVQEALEPVRPRIKPGMRVAVGVGSRGIANIAGITRAVLDLLKSWKVDPFIVPAMGSHGGATAEGQAGLLAGYGITEERMGVPIVAALDVRPIGATGDGVELLFSEAALAAEGVIPINRIKPHTDFSGNLGSGLLKMLVVGFGKQRGAAQFHLASSRHGYEKMLRDLGAVVLSKVPVLCGLGILEDQRHQTAAIRMLPAEDFAHGEEKLFHEARELMPSLPFDDIDLLIVDRIGKNISGSGLDPNIVGRGVNGYSSALTDRALDKPAVRRLFVRDLTPETKGNAVGIGMADFTTSRLVRAIDQRITFLNALTALTVQSVKVPIHFESDREAISRALESLALEDPTRARVVRVADTLSLELMEASETCRPGPESRQRVIREGECREMSFDKDGNLEPMKNGDIGARNND